MSNINKTRPDTTLEIGNRTFTLVFDLWALSQVELKTGKTVPQLLTSGSLDGVLKMLWAGCIKHHPDVSELEIGGLITMDNMGDVTAQLNSAFEKSSPPQGESKEGKTQKNG